MFITIGLGLASVIGDALISEWYNAGGISDWREARVLCLAQGAERGNAVVIPSSDMFIVGTSLQQEANLQG